MSLGYEREEKVYNLGDTANLSVTLYNRETEEPYSPDDLLSVEFTIQSPDGTKVTEVGEVEEDGKGTFDFSDTAQVGHYVGVASFDTSFGVKSARTDFEVVDPFAETEPSMSWAIANDAWEKFEDCFDGEEEGPWLREMTLNVFNKTKMEKFIDDALYDINSQHPPTNQNMEAFVTKSEKGWIANADLPLLTQGLVIQLIRHLMRSYVEQPNPVGAQIAWHDRRDYLQRWKLVLDQEKEQYLRMLAFYKRRFMGLGQTVSIVSSKAGRLLPAPMRTRNVGRGWW